MAARRFNLDESIGIEMNLAKCHQKECNLLTLLKQYYKSVKASYPCILYGSLNEQIRLPQIECVWQLLSNQILPSIPELIVTITFKNCLSCF